MAVKNYGHKFILVLILQVCSSTWSTTSSPYYQRFNDGSYNYGYNAGGGFSARQSGTASNEVSGQYAQLLPDGNLVNVRYKAGVGGFRPQLGSGLSTTARPYGFAYNTGDAFHQAAADQSGNVRGNYWYRDPEGARHDLRYRAGPGIGFVPTGGSLATPNGLGRRSLVPGYGLTTPRWNGPAFNDGPYGYDDPEAVGHHDPNGVNSRSPAPASSSIGDGSYNFGYRTPDSARQEGGDGRGNVHGSYSFRNGGGNHDLAFVAGPGIGFQPTGGTLARPNGLGHDGSYGNHPALGSSGGNRAGSDHGDGYLDPSYNAGGTGNVGFVGANGGSGSAGVGTDGHAGTAGHLGTIAGGLGTRGGVTHDGTTTAGIGTSGTNVGGSSGIGGGVTNRNSGVGSTGGIGHGLNSAGSNAGGTSGIGRHGGAGGLGLRGGSRGGGIGNGLNSAGGGGIGHGLNSAGANAGGSSGIGGHGGAGGLGSTGGGIGHGLNSGVGGLRGGGASGAGSGGHFGHGHQQGGFGGYGVGGQGGYGDGRGHGGGFASGSSGGLSGSAGGGHYNSGVSGGLADGGNHFGSGSSAANGGGLGTGGSGSAGNGGYSYGASGGGSGGSYFGSGAGGGGGGAHSAGLSVQSLQSSGSSGSGSSSGSSGGVISGEQHDLQRSSDAVQSLQAVGVSSATKETSTR